MGKKSEWYSSQVFVGDQLGRTIQFPTINLSAKILSSSTPHGVYAAQVRLDGQTFQGALFYGERQVLNEDTLVLEIYLLNFNREIYGQFVEFRLVEFVRPVLDFDTFAEMKIQLQEDIKAVKNILE